MYRYRLCDVVIHTSCHDNRLTSIIKLIQDSHQSSWYSWHSSEVVIVRTKRGWQCHADVSRAATMSLNVIVGILSNGYGNYLHPQTL